VIDPNCTCFPTSGAKSAGGLCKLCTPEEYKDGIVRAASVNTLTVRLTPHQLKVVTELVDDDLYMLRWQLEESQLSSHDRRATHMQVVHLEAILHMLEAAS